jgi:EmrB/QacA subfamily drug resistance transporter
MRSSPPPGISPSIDQDPALGLSPRAKVEILGAILLALFLAALDQTIVGVALPRITTDLRATNELYVWSITIYLLTSTITGPFYGKLSDLYGRKPLLMIGVTLFLIGSALSGLSGSMEQLILFRGIQGLGAGALFPIALAVIGDMFTPAERGKYQGLFGAVFGISSIVGPLLGGWLTDNLSWHWIFWVNLPIGVVALFVIWRLLPAMKRQGARHDLDYLGALVFTFAISALLIGLTYKGVTDPATSRPYEWTDLIVGGAIAVGLLLGAVFLWVESRAKEPIVPPSLFRNRVFSVSLAATFLASFGFFGAIVFLPRWFQVVRGISPTESGLQSLALLSGLILSSVASGAIISRTGRYKWLLSGSLAVMAIGMLLLTQLRADTPLPMLWVWMFITGVGIGPTLAGFTIVIQNAVSPRELGVATSNLTFFRQIGGSIGLAIVGTLFATTYGEQLPRELSRNGIPDQFVGPLASAINSQASQTSGAGVDLAATLRQVLPAQAQPFVDGIVLAIHESFSIAVADSFWPGVAAAAIATVVSVVALRELPLRRSLGPEPAMSPAGTHSRGAVPATE